MWIVTRRDTLKKFGAITLALLVVLGAVKLSGLVFRSPATTDLVYDYKGQLDNLPYYQLDVNFDPTDLTLEGTMSFTYTNDNKTSLNTLLFHLYPNAFKDENTIPYSKDYTMIYYPDGFSTGWITVDEVRDLPTSQPLPYREEGTKLWIDLPNPLLSGQQIKLTMTFRQQVPTAISRFGAYNDLICLGNWYPILAVFEEGTWQAGTYLPWGDPFHSQVGRYSVNFTLPRQYKLAHTGKLLNKEQHGQHVHIYEIGADLVRDFALVISPSYQVKSDKVGETTIYSYYLPGSEEYGTEALRLAKQSIQFFNRKFGDYPYPTFTVAQANLINGGMEYPQLVMMGKNLYTKPYYESKVFEFVLVHEIAHQWWYGLVGNDQIQEPWLDEGLANYSTLLFFEHTYGRQEAQQVKKRFIESPSLDRNLGPLDLPLTGYRDGESYYTNVYGRGALALEELHHLMGDRRFEQLMKAYFEQYQYDVATIEDYLNLAEKIGKIDLTGFRKKYFSIK